MRPRGAEPQPRRFSPGLKEAITPRQPDLAVPNGKTVGNYEAFARIGNDG